MDLSSWEFLAGHAEAGEIYTFATDFTDYAE